jgi:hypothetical protein
MDTNGTSMRERGIAHGAAVPCSSLDALVVVASGGGS